MHSCCLTMSQNSLKKSFGKVVSQIVAKIEMTQNKNWLFGRHLERVQHFNFFFFKNMIFYNAYIYGANFIAKFRWESGFLRLVPRGPPLGTNGSESTLVT